MPELPPAAAAAARRARGLPEVLAPAGAPDCLPAAVAGGADAVYLGLRHFNARGRAENFRKADLAGHVAYLHRHGLKCYLVMNTLLHDDEYPKALEMAAVAHAAAVDAVIVQDLGLWRRLARELPGLERHASTQMTVHSPAQVAVLAGLGAKRVILARELALAEVRACADEAARHGSEVEHFVHGALCYAFSGQCLMSNFAGCRSANRGTCAQNCRFDYLVGEATAGRSPNNAPPALPPRSEEKGQVGPDTVLSMKDLALVAQVSELCDAGVVSLKIEGRLKGPDYVYTTSRVYRAAVDAWAGKRKLDLREARELLNGVFSRGHTDAPLAGDYSAASRLHRYAPERDRAADATLIALDRKAGRAELRAARAPRAGQGFSFAYGWGDRGALPPETDSKQSSRDDNRTDRSGPGWTAYTGGFLVTAVDALGGNRWRCKVRIPEHGPRLPPDLPLFANSDHERKREAAQAMAAVAPDGSEAAIGVELTVAGALGEPLAVEAVAADGRRAAARSDEPLAAASSAPLDQALLADKLGALGGTGFACARIVSRLPAGLFLPAAALKRLRRSLVEALAAQPVAPPAEPASPAWTMPEPGAPRPRRADLIVAVGSVAAARAALAAGAAAAWLDDPALDLWGPPPPAIDRAGIAEGALWLRHPATAATSPHLASLGLPVAAGHIGVLVAARAAGLRAVADHPLNVFSTQTLAALGELGAEAAAISLECSSREIARLAARLGAIDAPRLLIVAHGRLPAMLTRQDHGLAVGRIAAIAAVPRDGGLPYDLQRRAGGDTVVWEGRRLCCPAQVAATATLVDGWILELGDLAPEAVAELTAAYAALRDGAIEAGGVERIAERHAPHGLFPGHLEQGSRELDAVLERQAAVS